jgi:hypothetical protein
MAPLPLQSTVVVVSAQLSVEAPASSIEPQPAEGCRQEYFGPIFARLSEQYYAPVAFIEIQFWSRPIVA